MSMNASASSAVIFRRAQAARRFATLAVMKMNPISDNDLILYFYQDGLDAGRIAEIDAALRTSDALRARYAELQRTLHAVDAGSAIGADAGFTQRVWRRWKQRIEATAPARDWRTRLRPVAVAARRVSPLAATCMLALAVGIAITPDAAVCARAPWSRARARCIRCRTSARATEGLLLTAKELQTATTCTRATAMLPRRCRIETACTPLRPRVRATRGWPIFCANSNRC